jgi:uncharacterized membrane protein
MVFFCDAVVAIAITLLALDIKIESTPDGHLHFSDLHDQWKTFSAFLLSFINIANFWKNHHTFFSHVKKIDEKMLWFNILWLLFIVMLPFSTSLVSSYFSDPPAIIIYCFNTLLITIFQNMIWDYASFEWRHLKKDTINKETIWQFRLYCNLDMINAAVSMVVAFWWPGLAFILLFTKIPMMVLARFFYRMDRPKF